MEVNRLEAVFSARIGRQALPLSSQKSGKIGIV